MKNSRSTLLPLSLVSFVITCLFSACFKDLPVKRQVYFNDFETLSKSNLKVYNFNGLDTSLKIFSFNNSHVFGNFNNNRFELHLDTLPEHNAIKIEFDLFIHDKWDGDFILGSNNIPDVWQMTLDDYPFYQTTFSNGIHGQSFPNNYKAGNASSPAHSDAWNISLPGVCALKDSANGSSLYKIEITTSHNANAMTLACSDALQPFNSLCQKSWSVDNIRITAIKY